MRRLTYWANVTPVPGVTLTLFKPAVVTDREPFFDKVLDYVRRYSGVFSYRLEDTSITLLECHGDTLPAHNISYFHLDNSVQP